MVAALAPLTPWSAVGDSVGGSVGGTVGESVITGHPAAIQPGTQSMAPVPEVALTLHPTYGPLHACEEELNTPQAPSVKQIFAPSQGAQGSTGTTSAQPPLKQAAHATASLHPAYSPLHVCEEELKAPQASGVKQGSASLQGAQGFSAQSSLTCWMTANSSAEQVVVLHESTQPQSSGGLGFVSRHGQDATHSGGPESPVLLGLSSPVLPG